MTIDEINVQGKRIEDANKLLLEIKSLRTIIEKIPQRGIGNRVTLVAIENNDIIAEWRIPWLKDEWNRDDNSISKTLVDMLEERLEIVQEELRNI